jgi:Ca-activated chloride channel family protein
LFLVLGSIPVFFFSGGLLEYLYIVSIKENVKETDNIVVLIDNSGSMEESDPYFERYNAMVQLSSFFDNKQRVGAYWYNDRYDMIFDNIVVTPDIVANLDRLFEPHKFSEGGTDLMFVMDGIFDKLQTTLTGQTDVIVISDGNFELDTVVIKNYANNGYKVHTIGVAQADLHVLKKISYITGGRYFAINDIKLLAETMLAIYKTEINHLLVDYRYIDSKFSMFLRILFLVLLGLLLRLYQAMLIEHERVIIMFQGIVLVLIGSILLEVFIQNLVNSSVARLIMLILFMVLIIPVKNVHEVCSFKRQHHAGNVRYSGDINDIVDSGTQGTHELR